MNNPWVKHLSSCRMVLCTWYDMTVLVLLSGGRGEGVLGFLTPLSVMRLVVSAAVPVPVAEAATEAVPLFE